MVTRKVHCDGTCPFCLDVQAHDPPFRVADWPSRTIFFFFCSHLVGRLVFVSTNDLLHSYHLFFFLLLVCSFISSAFSCILWILERVEELRTRVASSHRLEWSNVTRSWAVATIQATCRKSISVIIVKSGPSFSCRWQSSNCHRGMQL